MDKTTEEMKQEIKMFLKKMNMVVDEKNQINSISDIYFKKAYEDSEPGTYVFSSAEGYHFVVVGDRGGIVEYKISEDIDDIYFDVCESLAFDIAMDYARDHRKGGKDWRRVIFSKQLDLLRQVSDEYYGRGEKMVNEILKESPYNDKLIR